MPKVLQAGFKPTPLEFPAWGYDNFHAVFFFTLWPVKKSVSEVMRDKPNTLDPGCTSSTNRDLPGISVMWVMGYLQAYRSS